MTLKQVAENYGLTPEGVDYALKQYQIVMNEITHGMLSKLSYDAHDVLRYAQERWCDTCDLKAEQKPRLLTLNEVKDNQVCWIELEDIIFPAIYRCQGNDKTFSVFIINGDDDIFDDYYQDLSDNEIWLENDFMNFDWRCWSSKPTESQQKAVKWE